MIPLKSLLSERKFDLNKPEDAAEYLIRKAWGFVPKKDRFSYTEVELWIDNEYPLQKEKENFSNKFFPNAEDPVGEFLKVIETKLEDLEKKSHERILKKIDTNDPLFILKKVVRGKTFEGAKQSLMKNCLGAWNYGGGKILDNEADEVFNRLYKNAMGETVYSETSATYGRLSDIRRQIIPADAGNSYVHEYTINLFIDQYAGYKKEKFPEKVKVYRGTNSPTNKIRAGDFVTFDKDYAAAYARGKYGVIVSDILNTSDLLVSKPEYNMSELIYWPNGHKIKTFEGKIPTFKEFWNLVNSQ